MLSGAACVWVDLSPEQVEEFVEEEKRNFFWITAHLDPKPLFSHFFHWFELAEMDNNPNKNIIRKDPVLYNIFDSRNEGVATAVEEMFTIDPFLDFLIRGIAFFVK